MGGPIIVYNSMSDWKELSLLGKALFNICRSVAIWL